jgi:hypothetical protein
MGGLSSIIASTEEPTAPKWIAERMKTFFVRPKFLEYIKDRREQYYWATAPSLIQFMIQHSKKFANLTAEEKEEVETLMPVFDKIDTNFDEDVAYLAKDDAITFDIKHGKLDFRDKGDMARLMYIVLLLRMPFVLVHVKEHEINIQRTYMGSLELYRNNPFPYAMVSNAKELIQPTMLKGHDTFQYLLDYFNHIPENGVWDVNAYLTYILERRTNWKEINWNYVATNFKRHPVCAFQFDKFFGGGLIGTHANTKSAGRSSQTDEEEEEEFKPALDYINPNRHLLVGDAFKRSSVSLDNSPIKGAFKKIRNDDEEAMEYEIATVVRSSQSPPPTSHVEPIVISSSSQSTPHSIGHSFDEPSHIKPLHYTTGTFDENDAFGAAFALGTPEQLGHKRSIVFENMPVVGSSPDEIETTEEEEGYMYENPEVPQVFVPSPVKPPPPVALPHIDIIPYDRVGLHVTKIANSSAARYMPIMKHLVKVLATFTDSVPKMRKYVDYMEIVLLGTGKDNDFWVNPFTDFTSTHISPIKKRYIDYLINEPIPTQLLLPPGILSREHEVDDYIGVVGIIRLIAEMCDEFFRSEQSDMYVEVIGIVVLLQDILFDESIGEEIKAYTEDFVRQYDRKPEYNLGLFLYDTRDVYIAHLLKEHLEINLATSIPANEDIATFKKFAVNYGLINGNIANLENLFTSIVNLPFMNEMRAYYQTNIKFAQIESKINKYIARYEERNVQRSGKDREQVLEINKEYQPLLLVYDINYAKEHSKDDIARCMFDRTDLMFPLGMQAPLVNYIIEFMELLIEYITDIGLLKSKEYNDAVYELHLAATAFSQEEKPENYPPDASNYYTVIWDIITVYAGLLSVLSGPPK